MLEKQTEQRLVKEIKRIGGMCLKFVSPGMAGVPDRIILLPNGRIAFAELKSKGKKPRPMQLKRIKQLRFLGFKVYVIDSIEKINTMLGETQGGDVL